MKSYLGIARPGNQTAGKVSSAPDDRRGEIRTERDADDELKRIDSALRRLDAGRFGHCLYCGDQISVKRLDHDPAIDSCATCDEG